MSLPTASFVPVAAPRDGLALAFQGARRRRQRKAATASGVGVAAAFALLLTLGGSSADQTLLQEKLPPARGGVPAPLGPAVASPAPAADAPAAAAARTTATGRAGSSSVAAPLAAGAAATPAVAGRAGRSGPGPAAKAVPVSGPMSRSSSISVPSDVTCPVRKRSGGSRSLCSEIYAYTSSQEPGAMDLQAAICNTETDPIPLNYATQKELDIVVAPAKGGGEVWRWSVGHQFGATPHTVLVGPGDCVIWTTTWRGVDQQGRPLPKGSYSLIAEFSAAGLPQDTQVAKSAYTVR